MCQTFTMSWISNLWNSKQTLPPAKVVDDAFKKSNGEWHYLGEWHTHPEDVPTPSMTDHSSWNKHLKSDLPLILIIVGRTHFWVGKKFKKNIEVLTQI